MIDSGTLQMDTLLAIHADGQVKELAPGKFSLFISIIYYVQSWTFSFVKLLRHSKLDSTKKITTRLRKVGTM